MISAICCNILTSCNSFTTVGRHGVGTARRRWGVALMCEWPWRAKWHVRVLRKLPCAPIILICSARFDSRINEGCERKSRCRKQSITKGLPEVNSAPLTRSLTHLITWLIKWVTRWPNRINNRISHVFARRRDLTVRALCYCAIMFMITTTTISLCNDIHLATKCLRFIAIAAR